MTSNHPRRQTPKNTPEASTSAFITHQQIQITLAVTLSQRQADTSRSIERDFPQLLIILSALHAAAISTPAPPRPPPFLFPPPVHWRTEPRTRQKRRRGTGKRGHGTADLCIAIRGGNRRTGDAKCDGQASAARWPRLYFDSPATLRARGVYTDAL